MDYSNYTVFEILKYKIEFLECLEYSLITYELNEKDIEQRLNYLTTDFKEGFYKELVSSLFSSYNLLNQPISLFLYSSDAILTFIGGPKIRPKRYIKVILILIGVLSIALSNIPDATTNGNTDGTIFLKHTSIISANIRLLISELTKNSTAQNTPSRATAIFLFMVLFYLSLS